MTLWESTGNRAKEIRNENERTVYETETKNLQAGETDFWKTFSAFRFAPGAHRNAGFFGVLCCQEEAGFRKRAEKSPYPGDTGDSFFFRIRIKRIKDLISVHFLWI